MLKRIFVVKWSFIAFAAFGLMILGFSPGAFAGIDLTARAVSADSIRLDWAAGMRVSVEQKEEDSPFESIAVLDASCNTYLDHGLTDGKMYTYRLRPEFGWRYDFGPESSPAEGHIRVRHSDAYSPQKGFGIVRSETAESDAERDRGASAEPRLATLVFQAPKLTFVQELPNGKYLLSLASGDVQYEGSASVTLNGRQVVPLTRTDPGKFVLLENHPITVANDKLTVEVGGHGRLNYLTIQPQAAEAPVLAEASAKTFSLSLSPGNTTYYVDAAGDDARSGTAPGTAWKTLAHINALKLAPGDKVLLRAGGEFAGPLVLQGSGTEGKPIVIDKYGLGANPIINGEGKVENTIRLHNQHDWEIRNLTVTNADGGGWDDEGRTIRRAVHITAEDAGDVKHIHLKNLEIRDVRGMYRFEGNTTNGGIICQVLGGKKPTRFMDLRIEGCVFRTKSIDRYPVVVTSSWGKQTPCEVVWKDNTLDHAGRAHIVIPASEWPREKVYYFCPECREVFGLNKTMAPVCKKCGRVGVEDIFSEMAARLKRSWSFFEATHLEPDKWLFKLTPGSPDYSLWATALAMGYYGELRAMGFKPPWADREQEVMDSWIDEMLKHRDAKDNLIKGPDTGAPSGTKGIDKWGYLSYGFQWQLRNRVFLAGKYIAPPGSQVSEDFCRDKETALKLFNSLPWADDPYWACNMIGSKAILNHRDILLAEGKEFPDEVTEWLHNKIDSKYNPDKGYWGGEKANHVTRTNGNMKMLVTYAVLDWEIPNPKKIIDFTLSGADANLGFKGSGCSAFNQMFSLAAVRRKYPELVSYRSDQIDRYTAMTFMTFLSNWNEKLNFYAGDWNGKHNNGVATFMPHLLLDQPYMRACTIYNWRYRPMISRDRLGRVTVNKVIYNTERFPFSG